MQAFLPCIDPISSMHRFLIVCQDLLLMINIYNLTGNKFPVNNSSDSSIEICEKSNQELQNENKNIRAEIRLFQEKLKTYSFNNTGIFRLIT